MSSETSISSDRNGLPAAGLPPAAGGLQASDQLQPWQLFTLAGLIGATIVVFVSRGQTPSGIVLLSLIIFTAAIVGVATWRTLSPLTGKNEPTGPQILGGRTRGALEREKALVLRSIKELEFDRAMGKMSEKDFAEMSARLRARATGLIRQLDAGAGYREQIEREIAKRVGGPQAFDKLSVAPSGVEGQAPAPHQSRIAVGTCQSCQTVNDADARFCKNCGARMETGA